MATSKDQPKDEKALEEKVDAELAQGFRGVEIDQTPNENYTVAGVTSGKKTPETDRGKS